ncbi:MAG: acetyl-CoA decarbonylase/synthase complex subunit gamma [Thermaerobacter sp.]|jgi:acetyl-CoA decarbonylase/synthase complex subunit gamma|nr:acetyl-CoA decarbonylase/synthase complex subunit gamma [Thermaerobacter sp.]
MALSGLEIYKLTPKKNCRECGVATCMAFAMALANGKASADACPYLSPEAKAALGAAAEPPIRLVTIGKDQGKVEVGDEHVLFRHEKTFYHPTAIGITVADTRSSEEIRERVGRINELWFDRVGLCLSVNLVAVTDRGGDFAQAVRIAAEASSFPLVLVTRDPAKAAAALAAAGDRRPLLHGATAATLDAFLELAKEKGCPLTVGGALEELPELTERAAAGGFKDLVLAPAVGSTGEMLRTLTQIRRQALKKKFRPLGYPVLTEVTGDDPQDLAARASVAVAKYASVLLLDTVDPAVLLPLLTNRQDLYTDPQKPIQVEAKLWEVGSPDQDSPVYVTTNFSLTYFSVLTEIEASRIPSYLVTVDTDGTSVLTAWAAGKFGAEEIAQILEKTGAAEKVRHHKVIIPGYVAVLSGKLNQLSGWEVLVGPREATGIPNFARSRWRGEEVEAGAGSVSA